ATPHAPSGPGATAKSLGTQLAGKPLGIVGLGRIGRDAARRAAGLDMKVLGFDPFLAPAGAAQLGIETTPNLDSLLPRCDFLTVHTPLTEDTRNLIAARELALLPRGARVINFAPGRALHHAPPA